MAAACCAGGRTRHMLPLSLRYHGWRGSGGDNLLPKERSLPLELFLSRRQRACCRAHNITPVPCRCAALPQAPSRLSRAALGSCRRICVTCLAASENVATLAFSVTGIFLWFWFFGSPAAHYSSVWFCTAPRAVLRSRTALLAAYLVLPLLSCTAFPAVLFLTPPRYPSASCLRFLSAPSSTSACALPFVSSADHGRARFCCCIGRHVRGRTNDATCTTTTLAACDIGICAR